MNNRVAAVHDVKKDFKCDICETTFNKKNNLNVHVATVHEGKKPFECDRCVCVSVYFTDFFRLLGHTTCQYNISIIRY